MFDLCLTYVYRYITSMEIIFNNAIVESITGKLRKKSPWYIRHRNGHFHASFRGPQDCKIETFRVFYGDVCQLQKDGFIRSIILDDTERGWLKT